MPEWGSGKFAETEQMNVCTTATLDMIVTYKMQTSSVMAEWSYPGMACALSSPNGDIGLFSSHVAFSSLGQKS